MFSQILVALRLLGEIFPLSWLFRLKEYRTLRHLFRIHMTMCVAVDDNIRCQSTNANASNGLEAVLEVGACLPLFNAELLLDQFKDGLAATHVAGRAATYPDDVLPTRLSIKLAIEPGQGRFIHWRPH